MNNLKLLLKNSFNMFISTMQGKKQRFNTRVSTMLLVFAFLGIYSLAFVQAYSQFAVLNAKIVLFSGLFFVILFLVLYVSMKIAGSAKFNDLNLLLSLPISKKTIALSKIVSSYLLDFALTFLIFSPYLILYLITAQFSIYILTMGVFLLFIIPVLSVGLNYVLNYVALKLFKKFKNANIYKTIFLILLLGGFVYLLINITPAYGLTDIQSIDTLIYNYPPISWFMGVLLSFNLKYFILVLLITFTPFVLGVMLFSKTLGEGDVVFKPKNNNLTISETQNVVKSLFKKELKKYLTTPIYLINTIIGPVFILLLTGFIAFKGKTALLTDLNLPLTNEMLFGIFTIFLFFCISTTIISASSVSLEGKNLWVIKSLPIKEKHIFTAKAMLNFAVLLPFIVISIGVSGFILEFKLIYYILSLFCAILMSLIISFGGVYINLLIPKLNWLDEVQVIKQSLSVVMCMLLGFVLTAIPVVLFVVLKSLSITQIVLITTLINLVLFILTIVLLFTDGVKRFEKL